MRLRTYLVLMFSLLLAFTAGSIGRRGYASSRQEIQHFTRDEFTLANTFAAHHVSDFLNDPANRLLSELTLRARRGMLKLGDDRALGFDLAERLRVNPTLAWISYSDAATGHFVGVCRVNPNDIALNVSTPGHGPAQEVIVQPDGTTTPFQGPQPANYDPRERGWFRNAVAADGTVWSAPYDFAESVKGSARGITASRAWRASDGGPPVGVFTVDFFLHDLEQLLNLSVSSNPDLFCAVLEPDGTMISATGSPGGVEKGAALSGYMQANPHFKDNGPNYNRLVPLQVQGVAYVAALEHVDAPSGLKCVVASMEPRAAVYRGLDRVWEQMIEIALGALTVAVIFGAIMAYRVSEPLRQLGDELARVGHFQLGDTARPRSILREVNQLHDAADRMKSGLRSFMKYVPGDLVHQVLASGREAALGGEMRRLTIFFSDIANFTGYSESMPPDQLVHELADYLEILTRELRRHSATIDKFIGDGVLAFFNAPDAVAQHESCACRAALAALSELAAWQRDRQGAAFHTRVGLHTGEVLVGNIGTKERFAYTVLGDAVNVASRLENLNKIYGTQVLASGEVRACAGNDFEWRHVDRAAVAGRKCGLDLHELLGLAGGVDSERLRRRDLYEKALALYFARSFREARTLFAELASDGADPAAILMVERCNAFAASSPGADWDGVFAHEAKG